MGHVSKLGRYFPLVAVLLLSVTGCAIGSPSNPSASDEQRAVSDIEERGIESEVALALCRAALEGVAEDGDFVAAVDSDILSLIELEEILEYEGDANVVNRPGSEYVALCIVGGDAALKGFEHERILLYYLQDLQHGAVIFAYNEQ